MSEDFVFSVQSVETVATQTKGRGDAELSRQALSLFGKRGTTEVSISKEKLTSFWENQVIGLTDSLSEAQAKQGVKGFHVDEISFSIGVGAKGGLAFVAEGSIEASISVTLRRRDAGDAKPD